MVIGCRFMIAVVLLFTPSAVVSSFEYSRYLGTKTPYWSQQNWRDWTPPPKRCQPVHVEALLRHGARNPGKADMRLMRLVVNLIEDYSRDIDTSPNQWILQWKLRYHDDTLHSLTTIGQNEHYHLAQRMKEALPSILGNSYNPNTNRFSATQMSRAGMSASSFTYGLYEGTGLVGVNGYQPIEIHTRDLHQDDRLRFYTICPAYSQLHKDHQSLSEMYQFETSPLVANIKTNVTLRLGLSRPITFKELRGIYRICTYDSVEDGASQWCEVLGLEGVQIMEYYDDLKQWYLKGYGNSLNYNIACPLVDDIVTGFEDFIKKGKVLSSFRFAHAETVIPFLSLVGLSRDEDPGLLANWTYDKIVTRKFRASHMAPYTANILLVLYHCGGDNYLIRMSVNEKETIIPGCGEIFCPYSKFKFLLTNHTGPACQFNKLCSLSKAKVNPIKPTLWDALIMTAEALGLV